MLGTIIFAIFWVSLLGIAIFIYRKIPILAEYSLDNLKNGGLILNIKEKIKNKVALKTIDSGEVILLKMLSKARIVVLKAEHKIGCWLSTLRQKSIEKEKCFKENYWEKVNVVVKKRGRKPKEKKSESDINLPM